MTMNKKSFLAALLLLVAGLQTAWAQSVVVKLANNKTVVYSVSELDSISIIDANSHAWVDLGLPSGTLWATCNIGAHSPKEYGDYFAWGETETKNRYDWDNYKYCNGTYNSMTRYCIHSNYGYNGFTDALTELLPEDDAATAQWGADCEMPSALQFDELMNDQYTIVTDEYEDGNEEKYIGKRITSRINGNSILFPPAGHIQGTELVSDGACGYYQTSSLNVTYSYSCFCLSVYPYYIYVGGNSRIDGCSIRPVRFKTHVKVEEIALSKTRLNFYNAGETEHLTTTVLPENANNKYVVWESSDETVATVNSTGHVTAVALGTCTITCRATDGSGVTAECQVTFGEPQFVTSIELSETEFYMCVDEIKTVTATVLPEDAYDPTLLWSSSNESIATVDADGVVRAINPGTCYITCCATDGSDVEATCKVTVQNYLGYNNGHKWVNLALPSGTLWSTCNIGAINPDELSLPYEFGDFYSWGETETKNRYEWDTYKYCMGSARSMTKYCQNADYGYNGFTDDLKVLQASDDAATAKWGNGWQMPSVEQFRELFNSEYTNWYWTTEGGVKGVKVRSKKSSMSLFFPAANVSIGATIDVCYYWTRTLTSGGDNGAYAFNATENNPNNISFYLRYFGMSVRPVVKNTVYVSSVELDKTELYMCVDGTKRLTATVLPSNAENPSVIWASSDGNVATVDSTGLIRGIGPGTCYIICSAIDGSGAEAVCKVIVQNYLGYSNGHKWVNLGLPSGTLWSACNVGVTDYNNYEEFGDYYAWGETETKSSYSWNNYKYCNGSLATMTKYCQNKNYGYNGYTDNLTELLPEDDVATYKWGNGWQMPSEEQFQELFDSNYTSYYWTTERGVKGVKVKSNSTSMTLFFPAAGSSSGFQGQYGYYWTRTVNSDAMDAAIYTSRSSEPKGISSYRRYYGLSVRPVVKK